MTSSVQNRLELLLTTLHSPFSFTYTSDLISITTNATTTDPRDNSHNVYEAHAYTSLLMQSSPISVTAADANSNRQHRDPLLQQCCCLTTTK